MLILNININYILFYLKKKLIIIFIIVKNYYNVQANIDESDNMITFQVRNSLDVYTARNITRKKSLLFVYSKSNGLSYLINGYVIESYNRKRSLKHNMLFDEDYDCLVISFRD